MYVIICGTRKAKAQHVYAAMAKFMSASGNLTEKPIHSNQIMEVVSGMAQGADTWACTWAERFGIGVRKFPADWSVGKAAGVIRNQQMLDYLLSVPDPILVSVPTRYVVAVWDGISTGTADMVRRAEKAGIPVFVYTYQTFSQI